EESVRHNRFSKRFFGRITSYYLKCFPAESGSASALQDPLAPPVMRRCLFAKFVSVRIEAAAVKGRWLASPLLVQKFPAFDHPTVVTENALHPLCVQKGSTEMTKEEARVRFAEAVTCSESDLELDRAALLIAAEEYPHLVIENYLDQLDGLAEAARTGDDFY